MEVNNDEAFQVTSLGRNVNNPNVNMLLFPHDYYKILPRGPAGPLRGGGGLLINELQISLVYRDHHHLWLVAWVHEGLVYTNEHRLIV